MIFLPPTFFILKFQFLNHSFLNIITVNILLQFNIHIYVQFILIFALFNSKYLQKIEQKKKHKKIIEFNKCLYEQGNAETNAQSNIGYV